MHTTNTLSDIEVTPANKLPLETSISGLIVSDIDSFTAPLIDYFSQWPNTKLNVMTQLECQAILNGNNEMSTPDIVILDAVADWATVSKKLMNKFNSTLPIILITSEANTDTLRKALKFDIKDVLTIPFDEDELDQIIYSTAKEKQSRKVQGHTSVFINAKGGMGATVLATSIAHILAISHNSAVLIDPDAQFGASSGILTTTPKFTLSDALSQVENIDEYALNGMLTKHASGLRFIPNRTDYISDIIPEFSSTAFNDFLEMVRTNFSHTVVDLSRGLEASTLPAINTADTVFIVVQQNIPAIKEASLLIKKLKHFFGVDSEKIKIIINRYSKNIDIKPEDIKSSLHVDDVILIPNDYSSVSAATNLGELLATHFEKKPIVKSLKCVADMITDEKAEEATGLKRFFSFLRS